MVNILTVLLDKNRFGTEPPPYFFSTSITLSAPTADTLELVRLALKRIWLPGTVYKKAGVVFSGLEGAVGGTIDLFIDPQQSVASTALMSRLDAFNQHYGTSIINIAERYR